MYNQGDTWQLLMNEHGNILCMNNIMVQYNMAYKKGCKNNLKWNIYHGLESLHTISIIKHDKF